MDGQRIEKIPEIVNSYTVYFDRFKAFNIYTMHLWIRITVEFQTHYFFFFYFWDSLKTVITKYKLQYRKRFKMKIIKSKQQCPSNPLKIVLSVAQK